jgi:polyribonucleotide nucleotidyltransferase
MFHTVEVDLDGRKITFETGKMAKQANGAVVVRSGDSVVLVSACMADKPKANAGFFPLTVDYREYTYAAGKIPGGFIKREGRPSEKEILTSRLIDRPIRPLFPEGLLHETQVIAMVLSADPEQDPNTLAICGAAAALAISDLPFAHILSGVRVGLKDGKYLANPTYTESRESKLNIVVAGTEQGIVMVEAGAQQVSEAEVLGAIEYGHDCCKKIADGIRQLVKLAGKTKREFAPPAVDQEVSAAVENAVRGELTDALDTKKYEKLESYARVDALRKKALESFPEEKQEEAGDCYDALKERIFRDEILKKHRRPDGRAFDEIRKITIETGVLPRTHGSALFTRGETQALVTLTLGTKDDEQRIELLEPGEASKRFMLHYNFPPFSVGEVGFMRGPRGQRHPGIQWFELDGHGLRRIANADGCGGANLRARGRRSHGSGEGRRRVRGPDRYRRRRRSLRRHGLQGSRHARGHHRPADGYQGTQRDHRHHERSAGAGPARPAVHSG